ncbi:MAG: PEP-CTERM sorting domain-containing protein [Planctomycetota bacterium]|nr:PEP-CTERM sorting domain-containing protein [Planctomycetota bacterium]
MTMRSVFGFAVLAVAGSAFAVDMSTVNGFKYEKLWNDFPTAAATVTNSFPSFGVREEFAAGTVGNFANKHVGWLSNDGGASRISNNYFQSWTLSFNVNIGTAFDQTAPRREAGIEVHNPRNPVFGGYTDEGQVLIASDGEVAVFGGAMPFTGMGNVYTLGTTAAVTFEYFAPGAVDATKGAYRLTFVDAVTGSHSSGLKIWGDEGDLLYGLNNGASIGLKAQNQRNPLIPDFSDIQYSNVSVVPAPASLALVGLAGLVVSRRRR